MFKFEDNDDKVFCIKDSNVELSATFETLPKDLDTITIEWTRDGKPITNSDKFKVTKTKNAIQLAIQHVQRDDAGHYTLYAKTDTGETAQKDIELLVEDRSFGDNPPAFIRRLNDLAVKVGTRTRLLVEIRSATDVRVTWYRNDRRICENDRINFVNEGSFYCLEISSITLDDGGKWMCMAENLGGRNSCLATLNVLVPKAYKAPEFVEELRAILTEQGTVSLECKVVGVPTPLLRWFKDSKEIKAGDVFALTANPDDLTSLGTYTCEAVNCMGKTYSSSKLHISGRTSREGSLQPATKAHGPPPIFTSELKTVTSKIGDSLTLGCQVMVPPWPKSVAWYNKEGKIESSEKYKLIEDGLGSYILEIKPAEYGDEGEWKFVVTSNEGTVSISTCSVHMDIPKNYRKPRFMENLKAILTDEGLVSFECKVVGFPTPLLRWFKDGHELKPGDVYQLTGTNSLGSYSCIARNCMGEACSSAVLTLEDIQNQLNENERIELQQKNQPPKFIKGLMSCDTRINEEFKFTVQIKATTEPVFSWYRDDLPIDKTNERYEITTEKVGYCHLTIKCVEFVDQAEWKCVATNEFGHSTSTCFLKLQIPRHFKKPRFLECLRAVLTEEGAVNLECKVIGVPQPTLRWFKDGVELKPGDIHRIISGKDGECSLGTYTCEARNCMGVVTSSATLLGYEESYKSLPKPEPSNILQRHLSLSTIHEERTSQLYDTPMGDITVDDKGDVSFSFDGKEVSVSLYETPDLTEEEALQIVEMYADQISEHVTEQNIVELPPLRFVKETTQSGNLLMEAVVIDVSPDYFPPEEDMRTEADMEDISVVDPLSQAFEDPLSEQSMSKRRRKEESMKSGEVEEFFSLSQSKQTKPLSVVENYVVEEAHSDEEITETDLQTFESAKSSEKSKSDKQKRALKSDDSLQEQPPKLPPRKRPATDSKDEESVYLQDISGEQGDGLKTQPKKRTDTKTVAINKSIVEKVIKTVIIVKQHLIAVENEVVAQSTLMMSPTSGDSSIGIIKSVLEPVNSIECKLNEYNGEQSVENLMENLLSDLKSLNHGLSIIEKCVEMDCEGRTLVQRTSVCVIESVGVQMLSLLENLKQICLNNVQGSLQNESLLIINDMQTGIHITEDTIKSQTLMQEATALEASQRVSETVAQMQQNVPEIVPLEVVTTSELPKEANSFKLLCRYILQFQEILEASQKSNAIKIETLAEIQQPIFAIQNEIHSIEEKISKNSLKDTIEEKISFKILDTVSPPLYELNKCFEAITRNVECGNKSPKILDPFILPLQEIQTGLALIGHEIDSGFIKKESPIDTEDNRKLIKNVSQNVIYFDSNIENIRDSTSMTVYDSLIQLKITISTLIEKIMREPLTKGNLQIIWALKIPLEELNYCFRHIEERSTSGSLRDLLDPLNSLKENTEVVEEKLRQMRISSNVDELKKIRNFIDQCDAEIQLFDIIQLDHQERENQKRIFEQQISDNSHLSDIQQKSIWVQEKCDFLTNLQQNIVNIQEIIGFEKDTSLSEHFSNLKTLANPLRELSRQIANIREEILLENVNDISINDYKAILKLANPISEICQQLAITTKASTLESAQVFSSKSEKEVIKSLAASLAELRNCVGAIQHEFISVHEIQGEISNQQISLKTARPLEELRLRVEEIIHNIVEPDEISTTLDDVSVMKTMSEMSEEVKVKSAKHEVKITETKVEDASMAVIKEEKDVERKTENHEEKLQETEKQVQTIEKVYEHIQKEAEKVEEKIHEQEKSISTDMSNLSVEMQDHMGKLKEEIETTMIAVQNMRQPTKEIQVVEKELKEMTENFSTLSENVNEINKVICSVTNAEKSIENMKTSDLILVKYNLESLKKTLIILIKLIDPNYAEKMESATDKMMDELAVEKIDAVATKKLQAIKDEKSDVIPSEKMDDISSEIKSISTEKTETVGNEKIETIISEKIETVVCEKSELVSSEKLNNATIEKQEISQLKPKLEVMEVDENEKVATKEQKIIEAKVEEKIVLSVTEKVQESPSELSVEKDEVCEKNQFLKETPSQIDQVSPDTEDKSPQIEQTEEQNISTEVVQYLEKSKTDVFKTIDSIKSVRRTTPELQGIERQLSTVFENVNEIHINENFVDEILKCMQKAEESIATRKTSDIGVVKENFTTLKQSLMTLKKIITQQNYVITDGKVEAKQAEIGFIETKLEDQDETSKNDLKIVEIQSDKEKTEKKKPKIAEKIQTPNETETDNTTKKEEKPQEILKITEDKQEEELKPEPALKIEEATQKVEESVLKIEEPTIKVKEDFLIIQELPQKIEELPQKIEELPQKIEELPQKIEELPQKIEEFILKIEEPYQDVQESVLKIVESEPKLEENIVIQTLEKSKQEIDQTLDAIRKVRRVTPELKAVERQLSTTFENTQEVSQNENIINEILKVIESAEKSVAIRKTSDVVSVKEHFESLKQSLVVLKSAIVQQNAEIKNVQQKPQQAELLLIDNKENIEVVEANKKIDENTQIMKNAEMTKEKQIVEEKAISVVPEELKIEESKSEATAEPKDATLIEPTAVQLLVSKTKTEIEKTSKSIENASRPTEELKAVQNEFKAVFEKIEALPEDLQQMEKIIESIEKAESSLVARRTSDLVEVKQNLDHLKQSLIVLTTSIKNQKVEHSVVKLLPKIGEVAIIETNEELRILESNENIAEVESPVDKKEEVPLVHKIELNESTEKASDDFKKYLEKSKKDMEQAIDSIKNVRRITPELQAIERQLSTTFENVAEIQDKEKIDEILKSIKSAEESISIRKTSDAVAVKENFAILKQSLTHLQTIVTQQISQVKSVELKPQKGELNIIEKKGEDKVIEPQQTLNIVEEVIENLEINETATIKLEELLEQPVDVQICLTNTKKEIEIVRESIKNARRPTNELQAAQDELNILLEHIIELPKDEQKLEKVVESIEKAQLSLAVRRTSDIVLVKDNLETLKQSLIILSNTMKLHKTDIKNLQTMPLKGDLQVIESQEELKIIESNESIAEYKKSEEIDNKEPETLQIQEKIKKADNTQQSIKEQSTDSVTETKSTTEKSTQETTVKICLEKSKTEFENAIASIKSTRRPTTELQAARNVFTMTIENISDLPIHQQQIQKIIESIETAESSLVAKRTSDIVLVKENLDSLKKSLYVLKETIQSQSQKISDVNQEAQTGEVAVIEAPLDLKIVESNENIVESIKKETTEMLNSESKADLPQGQKKIIENTIEAIKKVRRPTEELHAIEKNLSFALGTLSELQENSSKIEHIIESIVAAETSLVAKKTSDVTLVKENLSQLKESLTSLKAQNIKVIDTQPLQIVEDISDLKIIESNEDLKGVPFVPEKIESLKIVENEPLQKEENKSLKIIETEPLKIIETEPLKITEIQQPSEIILSLSKTREKIENVMFSIRKARHPPTEVNSVEKVLTAVYEQLFELPKDEKVIDKAIESIEMAEISLVPRGAEDLLLIKNNLGILKEGLINLISFTNPQKAELLLNEFKKPQIAEIKNINEERSIQEEMTNIQKLEAQMKCTIEHIKKLRHPIQEMYAVEKKLVQTIETVSNLESNGNEIGKVIEIIENAEQLLSSAKHSEDVIMLNENLKIVKDSLNILKSTTNVESIETIQLRQQKPEQAIVDNELLKEETVNEESIKMPQTSIKLKEIETELSSQAENQEQKTQHMNESINKIKIDIKNVIESITKARRPTNEMQAVENELTMIIGLVNEFYKDEKKIEKVIKFIENAEDSLLTRRTSDIILVKKNLGELKNTLSTIKLSTSAQKSDTFADLNSDVSKLESKPKAIKPEENYKEDAKPKEETKVEQKPEEKPKVDDIPKKETKDEQKVEEKSRKDVKPEIEAKTEVKPKQEAKPKKEVESKPDEKPKQDAEIKEGAKVELKQDGKSKEEKKLEEKSKQDDKPNEEVKTQPKPEEKPKTEAKVEPKQDDKPKEKAKIEPKQDDEPKEKDKVGPKQDDKPKEEAKVEPKQDDKPKEEAKVEPKQDNKPKEEDKVETKQDNKPKEEAKVETKQDNIPKEEAKVELKSEEKPKTEAKSKEEAKAKPKQDDKPKEKAKVEPKQDDKPKEEAKIELKQDDKPKEEAKVETKQDDNPKEEAKVEPKQDEKPKEEAKVEPKQDDKSKEEAKVEPKQDDKSKEEAKVDTKQAKPKEEAKSESKPEKKPKQDTESKKEAKDEQKQEEKVNQNDKPKEEAKVESKSEEKPMPIKSPVLESALIMKIRREIENVSDTIKKIRRPTFELQTAENELNISLSKLSELEIDNVAIENLIKMISKTENSIVTKRTSDMIAVKESLTRLQKTLHELFDSKNIKKEIETQKVKEVQESQKVEKGNETEKSGVEQQKEQETLEKAEKTIENEQLSQMTETQSANFKTDIKLDEKSLKLKSEIENVIQSIKKARRPTSEIQSLEKSLSDTLDLKLLVEIPKNLISVEKLLKLVDECDTSLLTKKTSDMVMIKNKLSALKDVLISFKISLQPVKEETKQDEKTLQVIKPAIDSVKESDQVPEELKLLEQPKQLLLELHEKDLQFQYIIAIKQDIEEVLVTLKKARRPSVELQTLRETLIDLKPKVDTLSQNPTCLDSTLQIVTKAKNFLLTKRTMDLILLREKVTSLESSLTLLKSTIVTEVNGEIFVAKEKETTEKKEKKIEEKDTLIGEKTNIVIENKEDYDAVKKVETKQEIAVATKIEEDKSQKIEEEVSRDSKIESEFEPQKPTRRRKMEEQNQVEQQQNSVSDSRNESEIPPVPIERRKNRQHQDMGESSDADSMTAEPIKPSRRKRADDIKEEEKSLPRTPDSRRKRMPTFIARLKNRSAAENSILKLTCAVSEPEVTAKWTKQGMILKDSEKYSIENNNGVLSLEIKNACAQDAGEYYCFVSNSCGEIETSAFVTIFGEDVQPSHTTFTKNLKELIGLNHKSRW